MSSQTGPRDFATVLAGWYWLTDKGYAAVEQLENSGGGEEG